MAYKFIYTSNNREQVEVTLTTNAVTLDSLLVSFEDFLRGCGFYTKGHLEFVEDDYTPSKPEESEDSL